MRTIKTCPGIGDSVWLIQKLINQPETFHWKVGDGSPQRSRPLFDMFPQVTESFEYIPQCGYKKVKRNSQFGVWGNFPKDEFYMEANSWLEAGNRIEQFLPDLNTSFILPYQIKEEEKTRALSILGGNPLNPLIGIYTSAYSSARQWGGWEGVEWVEFIRLIKNEKKGYKFIIIGANYDIGIPDEIVKTLDPGEYINTIGEPLGVVVEILRHLDCFVGFPSGLSIINETIGAKQTVMFYPEHLQKLIDTWPDPERIKSGTYKGCVFCKPEQIFDWMVKNGKI
jgi:hypothetical protein